MRAIQLSPVKIREISTHHCSSKTQQTMNCLTSRMRETHRERMTERESNRKTERERVSHSHPPEFKLLKTVKAGEQINPQQFIL
jgi:hypothetical protein